VWALSFGLIALPYYQNTNPVLADQQPSVDLDGDHDIGGIGVCAATNSCSLDQPLDAVGDPVG